MAGIGSLGQQPAPDPESATISHEPDLEETSSANEFQALSRSLRNMALEGVSPEARSRMALYQVGKGPPSKETVQAISVDANMTLAQRQAIVAAALATHDQDAERFLQKVAERMARVGAHQASIEVRFENLSAEAAVHTNTSRNLPSVLNGYLNIIEYGLQALRIIRPSMRKFKVLDGISGVLVPGRLTLLLGPPSCGKSTLLKALAGKLDGGLKVDGLVTYNGKTFKEFRPERTAVYVEQDDVHIGEMTVRETMDFSARCQGTGPNTELLRKLREAEKAAGVEPDWAVDAFLKAATVSGQPNSVVTEFIVHMLGLGICADTIVGNAMRRGVSGGQKKRVTTGEMIVGPKQTMFMDEISTGLDSSTTFQIVKFLRDMAHLANSTIMVALLQPAPETFEIFDDVMLIAEGSVVYHGPVEHATSFFATLGFQCPERKGVADFLQEVTSKKDQGQYWSKEGQAHSYISCREMATAFAKSHLGEESLSRLHTPFNETEHSNEVLIKQKYALTGMQLFKALMWREIILVKRNMFLYTFRFVQLIFVALVTGTLFLRTRLRPDNIGDGTLYEAVIFFSLIQLMFDGFVEMNLTCERLNGFYKQRDNLFYPAWAFVLPTTLVRIPYSLANAAVWSVIVYWTVGLAPGADRFFTYLLLLFLLHSHGLGLFRFIAALGRNENVGVTGGCFLFLVLLLLGGFLLSFNNIPIWVKWFFWIDPVAYAQKALVINEFAAPRWQSVFVTNTQTGVTQTVGDAVLGQRDLPTQQFWIWVGVAVLAGTAVIFNLLTWFFHAVLGPLDTPTAVLPPTLMEEEKDNVDADAELVQPAVPAGKSRAGLDDAEDSVPAQNGHESSSKSPIPDVLNAGPDHSLESRSRSQRLSGMHHSQLAALKNQASSRRSSLGSRSRREAVGSKRKIDMDSFRRSLDAQGSMGSMAPKVAKGMVLPFKPLNLTFHHMNYYVDPPASLDTTDPEKMGPKIVEEGNKKWLRLLNDCSGAFRPSILTALVGSSGAGKTTLMDVLAGRKTSGKVTGDIRVNGFPKNQATFARVMGYVEQTDIHSPLTTVEEALWFSARLRFTKEVNNDTVEAFISEVEELVELTPLKKSLVGLPGISGLSVEQRKRLTIAVELVANPSVIFMDEPTSGLDARAAAIVMRTVRNTVDTGRTVVCTIHQPSIDIFEAFDDLLLMKVGGQVTYHGSLGKRSRTLIKYFEAIPGVPRCREGLNPATWMLQISTPAMEKRIGVDFADHFAASSTYQRNDELIEQLSVPPEGEQELSFPKQYAQSSVAQFCWIEWKLQISYWRNAAYNGTRLLFATVIALLMGCILWNIGSKRTEAQDVANILGALYIAMLFLGIINAMNVQPVVGQERTVLYREQAAGMYTAMPFALAQCCVEIPWNLLQSILFSCVSYWMINFAHDAAKFFWYLFVIFITLNILTFYGIMSVFITPDVAMASVLSGTFYGLWNLFAGFLIPVNRMPGWWIWYYYINPISWTLYGIIIFQLGDFQNLLSTPTGETYTLQNYLEVNFDYKWHFRGQVIAILMAFMIAFMLFAIIGLRFINFQKR